MKKIGIACDNYKLEHYKQKSKEDGFENVTVTQLSKGVKFISILVHASHFAEATIKINKICTLAEIHFKQSN